ncbi:hypothetical protein QTP86_033212, partial [Hemibagrus guttatus]
HPSGALLGDLNLPSDKLQSSGLLALLNSFSLSFNSCPPTNKGGNVLDLVFTCPSPATDMTATPLHISDHHLNNLHDPNQSGFKAAHSTETAILAVNEKLDAARSAKLSSVLILLDLSAAFDTVNHKTLLSTLRSLGICGTAWEWFASYLDGCSYQVTWKGLTSAPRRLSTDLVSHKAQYLVLSFSPSILTLLAKLYPYMGFHTTVMQMKPNLSSPSLPQIPRLLLGSQHVWWTFHLG